MTIALVTQAIRAFLETPTPQVLCIRGKWGVGKTYIWEEIFRQARADSAVSLPHYCYVSLFGLQSIDEVRQTIFENRMPTKNVDIEPSLESVTEHVKRFFAESGRRLSKISRYVKSPELDKYTSNISGGFRHIVSLTVQETIICFDDFERKKLPTKDLLGLINQFKDKKKCKCVIILNEDALLEEKADFNLYFEKVIDIPIEFSPTPHECVAIAIKGDDFVSRQIKENAIKLKISNIRIINRIKNVADDLMKIVEGYSEAARYGVIHSLTLFMWSKYDDKAIPLKHINGRADYTPLFAEEEITTDDEKKYNTILKEYGFGHFDSMDQEIMSGIERGFFDRDAIIREMQTFDDRVLAVEGEKGVRDAWKNFSESFDDDPIEVRKVMTAIVSAYTQHMKHVSRGNVDQVIGILKKIGFNDLASNIIKSYVTANEGKIKEVDEESNPFHPIVKDEEFRTSLSAALIAPPPVSMKEEIIKLSRYQKESFDIVNTMSEDDLYKLFKTLKGDEVTTVIEGSLSYRTLAGATEIQRAFTERVLQALTRIGKECPANAIRVQRFSVIVEEAEDDRIAGQN